MKAWSSIYNWFIPFCLGIFLAHLMAKNSLLIAPIYTICFLVVVLIYLFLAQKLSNLPAHSFAFSFAFLLIGFVGFQLNQSIQYKSHFAHQEYDYLEGKIVALNQNENSRYKRIITDVTSGLSDWKAEKCSGKALMYVDTSSLVQLKQGQTIIFPNNFQKIENKNNPGEFDSRGYWNNIQVYHIAFFEGYQIHLLDKTRSSPTIFEQLQHYFSQELERVMSGEELAIAKALLLGERSEISNDIMNAFSGTGAMHLLSVSGLHIGIFVWIMQMLISFFYPSIKRIIEVALLLGILWLYTGITGFSPSVNRAAIMFSFLLIARLSGKQYSAMRVLFISAFILLLYNPNYLFDIGFQLSYTAMIGIFVFYRPISSIFTIKNFVLLKCWETTAVGIAAQITTLPLSFYYFHQFPNYFIITNIGLMVFSGIIMGVGIAFLFLSWIPLLGNWIGVALYYSIHYLVDFIQLIYNLPFSVSTGIQFNLWDVMIVIALTFLLAQAWVTKQRWYRLSVVSLVLLFVLGKNYQFLDRNYFTTQLWALNNSNPTFFIKNNGKGYLVMQTNTDKFDKKTAYLLRGLQSEFGKNVKPIQLKKGDEIQFNYPKITLKSLQNGVLVTHKDSVLYLTGEKIRQEQINIDKIIVGKWVPYALQNTIEQQRKLKGLNTILINKTGAIRLNE